MATIIRRTRIGRRGRCGDPTIRRTEEQDRGPLLRMEVILLAAPLGDAIWVAPWKDDPEDYDGPGRRFVDAALA